VSPYTHDMSRVTQRRSAKTMRFMIPTQATG
jgi:hypothetical protein